MRRKLTSVAVTLALTLGALPFLTWLLDPRAVLPSPDLDAMQPAQLLHITTDVPAAEGAAEALKLSAYGLLTAAVIGCVGLALLLVWRLKDRSEVFYLIGLLSALPLALGVEYLAVPYGVQTPFGPAVGPTVLASVGTVAIFVAVLSTLRFAANFPRPLSEQQVDRFCSRHGAKKRQLSMSFRPPFIALAAASEKDIRQGARMAIGSFRLVGSTTAAVTWFAVIVVSRLIGPFVYWMVIVYSLGIAVVGAYFLLRVGYEEGPPASRDRVLWILGGFLAICWTFTVLGILPLGLGAFFGEFGYTLFVTLFMGFGPFIMLIVLVGALWLATIYSGALDPSLMIRKHSVYGVITVIFIVLFAVVESLVTEVLEARLGLPDMVGAAASGAVVALIVLPLRGRFSHWIDRLLPAHAPDREGT